jgi:hypothetical protein
MALLQEVVRENGVNIPLSFNNPNMVSSAHVGENLV